MSDNNHEEFIQQLIRLSKAINHITKDVAVLASDLFDKNFINQSFFGKKWTPSKYVTRENNKRGKSRKLLQNKGHLRKSIRYKTSQDSIQFFSNMPYADIHNTGGDIAHPGGTAYAYNKKANKSIWISNRKASRYASLHGKELPRTKPHNIPIPQRQFIGDHKQLQKGIETIIENEILKALK